MKLVQSRIVTSDVERLAGFYARLLGVPVALNDYYVEIQAGAVSVGFSRRRFTEYRDGDSQDGTGGGGPRRDEAILDFLVDNVDAEYLRIAALDVEWVMPPTTQPWGNRSMIFRDPAGNLVNVFSRPGTGLPAGRPRRRPHPRRTPAATPSGSRATHITEGIRHDHHCYEPPPGQPVRARP
jgi:catechol 2,3-dioxygenase-like lactoylglutathione lyase family enzyme